MSSFAMFLVLFTGCKVADDAKAAASQMSETAHDLRAYYEVLIQTTRSTLELEELQQSLLGVPLDDGDRAQVKDTVAELEKRRDAAGALDELGHTLAALTSVTAPDDVSAAATKLGNELVTIKALPSGSPVPDAVGEAGKVLLQWIQQHKEKEAARKLEPTLLALADLFAREEPAYQSLYVVQTALARQLALELARRNAVDSSALLQPALRPFGMRVRPGVADLEAPMSQLLKDRISARAAEADHKEQEASDAMLASLKEMNARIHLLATEKPMSMRGKPASLATVETWLQSLAAAAI